MSFTVRTLVVAIAAIALALGALVNPTTTVATVVVNSVLCALLASTCLAVSTRHPARSFWLGFTLCCVGTLVFDELGRRRIVKPAVFTQTLEAMAEEFLPSLALRGEPGTTLYFRTGSRLPIQYSVLGEDGTTTRAGRLMMEQVQRDRLLDKIGPLEELPHVDSIPNSLDRSTIFQHMLACFVGLIGGTLSYSIRRRVDLHVRGLK